jgi:hypothetical protein
MNFEDLQKAWQCQQTVSKLDINARADALLKEVRRDQQLWGGIDFWGAALEIGGEFVAALFFLYQGLRHATWAPFHLPGWDFVLLAFACAGVGIFRAFMLARRLIAQRRKQNRVNDSLKACIKVSLSEVNHEIWLQRNVFWWSLLPSITAFAVFFGYASLRFHTPTFFAFLVLFVIPLAWCGYRLNQFTLRKVLEPRRRELETLLASLK